VFLSANERIGLVLSGGGARAAYEVGVLKAIYNGKCAAAANSPAPEVFSGTGAGAFNAAVIASRLPGQFPSPIEYLESLWADEIPHEGLMRNNRVYRRRVDTMQFLDIPFMWRRPLKSWALYFGDLGVVMPKFFGGSAKDLSIWNDLSPMQRLISESVSLGVIRDGEGAARPNRILRVISTEKGSGRPYIFKNADFTEEIGHKAILSSCALPMIFPPVDINGKEYFYGGLVMQAPLDPAVEAGSSTIHLIHNQPKIEQLPQGEAPNALETLNRSVAVALGATLEKDLDNRRRMNAANGSTRVVVHQYRPKTLLGGNTGLLNFSRENIKEFIATGERDASQHDCAASECIL
jgi:NTE family protein